MTTTSPARTQLYLPERQPTEAGVDVVDHGVGRAASLGIGRLRCARVGHRLEEGAVSCPACRAIGLWPGIDRRKLSRAAPNLDKISRLAARRSSLSPETIRGMLVR